MGKYLERNFLIDGMKPVIRHPSLKLFTDTAGAHQTFDGYPDNIRRIELQNLALKLYEPSVAQFAFVLLEDPAKPSGDGGNLELRNGGNIHILSINRYLSNRLLTILSVVCLEKL